MNLVLTYCWREWRAQRALLGAFVGLGLAALCLVFTLVPATCWQERGMRAFALAWFVVLGGGSVVAFAAPQLVRSEFGSKGDQFLRRMPGALRASFGGKLLFLLLATIALPLLGLAVGQAFLAMNGLGPADVFRSDYAGEVSFDWPSPVVWLGYGALLIPWVWAIGTWLPNGRMALGGALVVWLVLGLLARGALHFSPGLMPALRYEPWIAFASVFGFVAAYVSWVVGRREGGALRSLRSGLMATSIGLLPPAFWLGERTYDYHHPDPECVARLDVTGISPDHRYVLVRLQSQASYQYMLPFRIDLHDGTATQLHGVGLDLRPDMLGRRRSCSRAKRATSAVTSARCGPSDSVATACSTCSRECGSPRRRTAIRGRCGPKHSPPCARSCRRGIMVPRCSPRMACARGSTAANCGLRRRMAASTACAGTASCRSHCVRAAMASSHWANANSGSI